MLNNEYYIHAKFEMETRAPIGNRHLTFIAFWAPLVSGKCLLPLSSCPSIGLNAFQWKWRRFTRFSSEGVICDCRLCGCLNNVRAGSIQLTKPNSRGPFYRFNCSNTPIINRAEFIHFWLVKMHLNYLLRRVNCIHWRRMYLFAKASVRKGDAWFKTMQVLMMK